jgi:hypothetical protein
MSKSLIVALSLIGLCVLFFIFTGGKTTITIFSLEKTMRTSVALLSFTTVGVVIGALLKK